MLGRGKLTLIQLRPEQHEVFEEGEHTCQRFVSRDLVFRWTALAQG
jgi:hypothetical protein